MQRKPFDAPRTNRRFPQQGGIRRALVWLLGAAVTGVGLYAVAGYVGAPWLVDRWLTDYEAANANSVVSRDRVRFDPWTLELEILALTFDDGNGANFRAERLAADFAARSLIEFRPIAEVAVDEPTVRLSSAAELPALGRRLAATLPRALRAERIELRSGSLITRAEPGGAVDPAPFDLSLQGLDRAAGTDAAFELHLGSSETARVTATGLLSAELDAAEGQLQIAGLSLDGLAGLLGGIVGNVVGGTELQGQADLTADFAATARLGEPVVDLTGARLVLDGLSLVPATGLTASFGQTAASAELVIAQAAGGLDLSGRIVLDGARLSVRDARTTPPTVFVVEEAAVLATAGTGDGLTLNLA
ncbi:MAG: hypothetical protein R3305_02680, partial [Gammaproteobacteria bacterium]|nr:hypothetical protein [Gammaproteobacteria bacterium]